MGKIVINLPPESEHEFVDIIAKELDWEGKEDYELKVEYVKEHLIDHLITLYQSYSIRWEKKQGGKSLRSSIKECAKRAHALKKELKLNH